MSTNDLIVGRGRLGSRLARALDASTTPGRAPSTAAVRDARAIVLAVPDPAIAGTAARIAPHVGPAHVVLHAAGSLDASVLAPCAARGAAVGVMHPLVAIASDASELEGRTFVIDGDARAIEVAVALAERAGARAVVAPLHGPAYHAAAALLANGSTALAAIAVALLERLGTSRRDAERAVAGLLASVAVNVESAGVPRALTGPIVRGDAKTVARHRRALAELDRAALAAYDAIAPAIVEVATEAGLDPAARRAIRRALAATGLSDRRRTRPRSR